MCLIGIDVGSSSVKVAAYSAKDYRLLALFRRDLSPRHPQSGWCEQDPEEVWQAVLAGLRHLMAAAEVRKDPPRAIAVSASGRENFLADANGAPLGACIMTADTRGAKYEAPPANTALPEAWSLSCGHLRERMDPVFRLLWWREHDPRPVEASRHFLGWHEFLSLRLAGRAVIDRSLAARWLVYDLESKRWALERAAEYGVDAKFLPEILPWGATIGAVRREIASEVGLPPGVILAVGGFDLICSTLGAGVLDAGAAGLVSGSFENLVIPASRPPSANMLLNGLSVTAHPGAAGKVVLAFSPTGALVLNWARNLLGVSLAGLDGALEKSGPSPSPVLSVPYLAGSMLHRQGGRRAKGALTGLTLATSGTDIVKAFMESIAYEHLNTLALLRADGIEVTRLQGCGGGTKSAWWTQLKADVLNMPISAVDLPESGTLGAAMLAGVAAGTCESLEEARKIMSLPARRYEPDPARASLHSERIAEYRKTVPFLLSGSAEG